MNQDQKSFLFLASVPVVAILIVFMTSEVKLDLSLTSMERRLLNFSQGVIPNIPERTMAPASSLKSPISISKSSKKGFPETPLKEISPPLPQAEKRVSMILVNKTKKIAIIDGMLVKEGDILDQYRITSIEKNKVLLKGKEGEKWLTLE